MATKLWGRIAWAAAVMGLVVALTACGGDQAQSQGDGGATPTEDGAAEATEPSGSEATEPTEAAEPDQVSVQLLWLAQAQFAGYFAADELGYYEDEKIEITVKPGGPDASVAQLVASGDSQFGVLTLGQTLQARDQGIELVNIAQIFTRPAYRLISFKDANITSVEDLRGKTVGAWPGTLQLFAALEKFDIDQDRDLTLVQQAFDMNAFLEGELDAASATTYNELAQVLKAGRSLDEINMIDFADVGTFQLEDGIIANPDFLDENPDVAERFLRATLRGWIYCRDNPEECVDMVLDQAPDLDPKLQLWMMNEVNKIIWSAEEGVGYMPEEGFEITASMLEEFGDLQNPVDQDAAVNREVWQKATAEMDEDLQGSDFEPLDLDESDL